MFGLFRKKKDKYSELYYRNTRLSKLGFSSYDDYLNSHIWEAKRKKFKKSSYCSKSFKTPCCLNCGSKKSPQVHHLTYKNLGNEKMQDLVLLCRYCHDLTHCLLNLEPKKYDLSNAHQLARKVFVALDKF